MSGSSPTPLRQVRTLRLVHTRPSNQGPGASEAAEKRREHTADLVRAARRGEREAREALYRSHVGEVTRLCAYMLRRQSDIDDVIQDTFVAAFDKLSTLRDPSVFGGWLARIAANLCRGRMKRVRMLRRIGFVGEDDFSLEQVVVEDASPEERLEVARFVRALDALDPESRAVWTLRHIAGLSLEETAAEAGVSLATIKRRLNDIEARLRMGGAS